jgi:hypothetical protein
LDNIRQAIALDPGYALAKAFLSVIYMLRWIKGRGMQGDPERGLAVAREAILQGSDDPSVLRWAGHTLGFWGDYDRAIALLEKAARLNVNGSQILASLHSGPVNSRDKRPKSSYRYPALCHRAS